MKIKTASVKSNTPKADQYIKSEKSEKTLNELKNWLKNTMILAGGCFFGIFIFWAICLMLGF